MASQSSKEIPNVEDGGKVSFLEKHECIILKKNPILQAPEHPAKEKVQRKLKKSRKKVRKAATQDASGSPEIGHDNVIIQETSTNQRKCLKTPVSQ